MKIEDNDNTNKCARISKLKDLKDWVFKMEKEFVGKIKSQDGCYLKTLTLVVFSKLESEIGIGNWNRKLESEIGIGNWNRKLESETGIGNWNRKLE